MEKQDSDSNNGGSKAQSFIPRRYQMEVLDVAKKRNTIAVLETGAGKTLIAVMLIRELVQTFKSLNQKKLVVFLAPTVNLVIQQFETIKAHTNFRVGQYYGAMKVDDWTVERWEKEVNEHDVFVMTPQVLLDALRKAFLRLEIVGLMIFDESHRASGNHAYTKIMKEFYHKSSNKPKIFGMTASPVIKKGVSSSMDCENQISELESILDSQVCTTKDRKEIEACIPSAKETCRFYDQALPYADIKLKVESSWSKFDAAILSLFESLQSHYRDMDDKLKMQQKRLSNDHAKILYCLDELGLICASEAVKVCLENAPITVRECQFFQEIFLQYKGYLEEVLCIFQESLSLGIENHLDTEFDSSKALELGYVSPKLLELIRIFQSFGREDQVQCLIFVKRIVTAKVIERFVKNITYLSHYTVSYITGSSTSVDGLTLKLQKETLESFCSGKVNFLFATDVVEEGIHIPQCSTVIRFDLPQTVRSYIQSRGRARQFNSQFVIMLERGNRNLLNQMFDIIRSEQSMTDTATNRDPEVCISGSYNVGEDNSYIVVETGASITADSSVNLIHRYCNKLPGDKYYVPKPTFFFSDCDGLFQCTLKLPLNAAFETLVGPSSKNLQLAKQLACLEACKKLHQMGALNHNLLPAVEEPLNDGLVMQIRESAPCAGTTKRKELHGTTPTRDLFGTWNDNDNGVTLQSYKFNFSCNVAGESYCPFTLLIESKLDDDVGNIEVELYLVSKSVRSVVSYCGQVHLDAEQIKKSKCFQEFFFNGMFGRLLVGPKISGVQTELLLNSDMESLWSPSKMYLLLPLETLNPSSRGNGRIDWRAINSCTYIVELLREKFLLNSVDGCGGRENSQPWVTGSSTMEFEGEHIIRFANNSVHVDNLKDVVVVAVHTGKIYSIVEAVSGTSAESEFDGNMGASQPKYATFSEYFHKKYGVSLTLPGQPLLRLKQSHNAHNLLLDFYAEVSSSSKKNSRVKKQEEHVHMPPELLLTIDVSIDVIKSLYLLPSLMQRLESLMSASQLRKEINCGSFHIPSSLILEALTTLRCSESFSMERLELLGDSVLKYAVSCHLFIKYPGKHEGQLSNWRSWAVRNSTLYELGTSRRLQGYIRETPFEPRRWVAPGQHSLHPVPCECGVDTLEVPLESRFQTENPGVDLGSCCDKGHRWMGSKTISDCVEALIGSYYVAGGLMAALHVMKWLGIVVEVDPSLVSQAISNASLRSYIPKETEIAILESKIGYQFTSKGLLHEAITHASDHKSGTSYCYQRLEFLGDSVLDLLITQHHFRSYPNIDPGELTDLRSASVNNESFAQVAVRKNLQQHLQHNSWLLKSQIEDYVNSFSENNDSTRELQEPKGPKALGDMIESIAGAILLDSNLSLDAVWKVYELLLSPIVTPDKLELPPLRKLNELCDSLGYFVKHKCVAKGNTVVAELKVQLNDILLVGHGVDLNKKGAKGIAASELLTELEMRGISASQSAVKRRKQDVNETFSMKTQFQLHAESPKDIDVFSRCPETNNSVQASTPVIESIITKKGGPRTSLFNLCKKMQWPRPTITSIEEKSRTPIEFGEGPEKRHGFNSYVSNISLHIPSYGVVDCTGDPKADKKSSFDSAALVMLHTLKQMGKLVIVDSC